MFFAKLSRPAGPLCVRFTAAFFPADCLFLSQKGDPLFKLIARQRRRSSQHFLELGGDSSHLPFCRVRVRIRIVAYGVHPPMPPRTPLAAETPSALFSKAAAKVWLIAEKQPPPARNAP